MPLMVDLVAILVPVLIAIAIADEKCVATEDISSLLQAGMPTTSWMNDNIGDVNTDKLEASETDKNGVKYVVCLSSTPWRIGSIVPVIDSLLEQRPMAPTRIVISVPHSLHREHEAVVTLNEADLEWTKGSKYKDVVHVHRVDKDFGPATKLLGCLPKVPEHDACVFVTDDDMPRPTGWAKMLQSEGSCGEGSTWAAGGFNFEGQSFGPYVMGCRGWAIRRSLLSEAKLVEFWNKHHPACNWVDDQLFTGFLRKQGISVKELCLPGTSCQVPDNAHITSGHGRRHASQHPLSGNPSISGQTLARTCEDALMLDIA